jgi:hypothetical protein
MVPGTYTPQDLIPVLFVEFWLDFLRLIDDLSVRIGRTGPRRSADYTTILLTRVRLGIEISSAKIAFCSALSFNSLNNDSLAL